MNLYSCSAYSKYLTDSSFLDLEPFHNLRRISLADSCVVRQRIVALVQLRVRNSTVGVYPLVVTEHIGIDNWDS